MLALIALIASVGCTRKAEVGPKLTANIARVYTPANRESRFVLNAVPIEGSVKGKSYFDISSDGRSALAWVDTVVYFVSEKGVDQLGTGIGDLGAEISYDGQIAFFVLDGKLNKYSLSTRSSEVIDENIENVIQFAVSPKSESYVITATYKDAPDVYVSKLYTAGGVTEIFENRRVVVMTVSDDAGLFYYLDTSNGEFRVLVGGDDRLISNACGAASNYNFTRDFSEVTYTTSDGANHFYRLSDGMNKQIGDDFGFTLKTEVYSISKVTTYDYINDIDSFLDGLFMLEHRQDDNSKLYDVGYLDKNAEMTWLAKNAVDYKALPDGSGVVWLLLGSLHLTDITGKDRVLVSNASDFAVAEDGTVYYVNDTDGLYAVKGNSTKRVDTGVGLMDAFGSVCVYIKDISNGAGTLYAYDGSRSVMAVENAVRIDARHGHVLIYADPVGDDKKTTYTEYFSADGLTYTRFSDGVEP